MSRRMLHLLSQRPSLTGSGVTLEAWVRHGARAGWQQEVVVGVPAEEPFPEVGGLSPSQIHPLFFGKGELDFPVPGMSDVMPYRSTRFSAMTSQQLQRYRQAWKRHLQGVARRFQPDLVHSHHVWLLSSLLKDLWPQTPVVTQCHATGFRQMSLCPHLAEEVRTGCARNDRFLVLHPQHATELAETLQLSPGRVDVVGAGYREELFHAQGREREPGPQLLYIGKYSAAKGLPWLLDALEGLERPFPELVLHLAGSGAGDEAEALRQRMEAMRPRVVLHGQLPQPELAALMRRCHTCVLPSFYEGVPLVLVEALACGCRLVATRLPGVTQQLTPHLGDTLQEVPLPRLTGIDRPDPADLPAFVRDLRDALRLSLSRPALGDPQKVLPGALAPFTWRAVFQRVEAIWLELLGEA